MREISDPKPEVVADDGGNNYFNDLSFRGHFGGLAYGNCVFWHDCPIVFTARDGGGADYLVFQIDEDRDGRTTTHMAVPIPAADFRAAAANRIARAALRGGAAALEIVSDFDLHVLSSRELAPAEAEEHVGAETLDAAPGSSNTN
jgi:hypothetical protein